jgi:nitrate reductase cytochrome c-type subunit
MKRMVTGSLITLTVVFFSFLITGMQGNPDPVGGEFVLAGFDQAVYQGVAKCKTCHKKKKQGEQYLIWKDSKHATAYATLAGEKAAEIAASRGIDNPQTSADCLKCHVTAYDVAPEFLGKKYSIQDGVGCESCHGAGENYYKKKTMKSILREDITPESVGLSIPDEKKCLECHNEESPSFKEFDYETAKEKITHPIPEETKAAVKAGE